MTGKVLLASLLSAVIFFMWGWVFWGMFNGFNSMSKIPNEDAVTAVLKENITESGSYFYPGMDRSDSGEAAMDRWEAKHEAGPLYFITYRTDGAPAMDPKVLVVGFLHLFISALILC